MTDGRDLGRAWRTDDGGGPSSKHRLRQPGATNGHPVIRHCLGQLQYPGRQVQCPVKYDPQLSGPKRDGFGKILHRPLPHIVRRHLMARAVEVSGFDTLQQCKDFVKSMKPGWLGGHGGSSCSTTC